MIMLLHTKSVVAINGYLCVNVALNVLITRHVPALAPTDHFQNKTNKHLAGKQYRTDDEAISAAAVEDFFEDQNESFYATGIQAL